eukprot:CAMPEP_0170178448 /NCGR_PEP_ID=MMETSP0040_2-20121228/11891_1 /TAXON_ID=641309 /ORGANISM="Lotharella oceanica, Strain CCMP622" /LENGTH=113 /DNA_ID=CAMNT_0010421507 /DNA_START=1 /DNA_END=342 /DNA_ORIENTATION=+
MEPTQGADDSRATRSRETSFGDAEVKTANDVTVKGIERLQKISLNNLSEAGRDFDQFNSFSKEQYIIAKKNAASYCKRIRKLRESLYDTFDRIRKLKQKIEKLEDVEAQESKT